MSNYTITKNETYNSLEISFTEKPRAEVREALKALQFRWNGKRCIWYGYATEEATRAAIEGKEAPEAAEYDWALKIVQEKKDDILEKLKNAYRSALFCNKMQFTVYIWEDGDITILEDVAGGSREPANLHYWKPGMLHCLDLATFCFQGYDWTAIAENPLVNFEDEIEYHPDEDAAYKKWISDAGDDVDEDEKLDWLFRHAIETECAIEKDFVDEDVANIDFEEEYLSAWI